MPSSLVEINCLATAAAGAAGTKSAAAAGTAPPTTTFVRELVAEEELSELLLDEL